MTTAGAKLVELSGLGAVSALEHFTALRAGSTTFVSRMSIWREEQQQTVAVRESTHESLVQSSPPQELARVGGESYYLAAPLASVKVASPHATWAVTDLVSRRVAVSSTPESIISSRRPLRYT